MVFLQRLQCCSFHKKLVTNQKITPNWNDLLFVILQSTYLYLAQSATTLSHQ